MANISVKRFATATWSGDVPGGTGHITTQSGILDADYSFGRRFGNDPGTNPEELLGAAHAGCFSMALAFELTKAKFPPTTVETKATVHLVQDDSGFTIIGIDLVTNVTAAGIDDAQFQEIAEGAKRGCPLSKALAAVPIALEATLSA